MSSEDSQDSNATSGKMAPHRKRKRRKWKKSASSDVDDSRYSAYAPENESPSSWFTGPTWYWFNYQKALEWQSKHNVALWKSYALGLQQENKTLTMELWKQLTGRAFSMPLTFQNLEEPVQSPGGVINMRNHVKNDEQVKKSNFENEGIEFEMSEEMMKFFEQSIKHKMEMKRLKDGDNYLNLETKELQETHLEREKEMKLLYGDGSSMIIGMETAVQLSYDKYCDLKSPKYWPNIPFKL